jgi:hypothetical protein
MRRYHEDIIKRVRAEREVEWQIAEFERELRLSLSGIRDIPEQKPELIQIAC